MILAVHLVMAGKSPLSIDARLDGGPGDPQGINLVLRPSGWTIPDGGVISHRKAEEIGLPAKYCLWFVARMADVAEEIVMHDLKEGEAAIGLALHMAGGPLDWLRAGIKRTCTAELARPICKIADTTGDDDSYRLPKLSEACDHFKIKQCGADAVRRLHSKLARIYDKGVAA